jgi:hypothetical protein
MRVKTHGSFVLALNKDGTWDVKRNTPEVLALCKVTDDDTLLAVLSELNLTGELKSIMENAPDVLGMELMRKQSTLEDHSHIDFIAHRLASDQVLVEILDQESSNDLRLNLRRLLGVNNPSLVVNT